MTQEPEQIRIEAEAVRLLRPAGEGGLAVEREVRLADLTAALADGHQADRTPVLPEGSRLFARWRHTTVLVIEEAPRVRRVRWSAKTLKSEGSYTEHHLAFPFIVYLIGFYQAEFDTMRIYFRTEPLRSEEDALYLPNLWNVQAAESPLARCRACLRGRPEGLDRPVGEQAAGLIEFFWSTGFNQDIEDNCFDRARTRDVRIATLEAWEAATQEDPLFALGVAWEPIHLSLGQALDHWRRHGDHARRIETAADLADIMYRLRETR
jgi:hypothetical protein